MGFASWWNKLRGRPEAPRDGDDGGGGGGGGGGRRDDDPDEPARRVATTAVNNGVVIHEYRHVVRAVGGPIAARTYITEGLAALGADEIRATVPRAWDEDASGVAFGTLATLGRLAAEGQPARLGGFTGFESSGLANGKPVGITYARGTPVPGMAGAQSALVAVLLHPEELELAKRGLAMRVLGHLAARARVFPYPACWELRDAPVFRVADQAASLLEKMPCASLGDVRVTASEEPSPEGEPAATIVVSLPPGASERAKELWSDASLRTLALLARLAPSADGQAIWVPGAAERTATGIGTSMPRRLGLAFVMLVGSGDAPAELRYIEDGVGLLLSEAALDEVREALLAGNELTLPLGGRGRLVLEHRSDIVSHPFTGGQLHAEKGWETYHPDTPRASSGPVEIGRVVLGIPEEMLAARVEVATLAAFMKSVEQILEGLAERCPVSGRVEIAIGLTLRPDEPPEVKLAFRGASEIALLGELQQELDALDPVPVRGEVPFWIEAVVGPPRPSN